MSSMMIPSVERAVKMVRPMISALMQEMCSNGVCIVAMYGKKTEFDKCDLMNPVYIGTEGSDFEVTARENALISFREGIESWLMDNRYPEMLDENEEDMSAGAHVNDYPNDMRLVISIAGDEHFDSDMAATIAKAIADIFVSAAARYVRRHRQ